MEKFEGVGGQIARCNCDARCDSNRAPPSASDAKKFKRCENPLAYSEITGEMPQKLQQKSCDVGQRCEMSACILTSSDARCLRFGLSLWFQLACDASARDAKSLAMQAERYEPLSCHCIDNFGSTYFRHFCNKALAITQSRKCAINHFWTKNSAELLG